MEEKKIRKVFLEDLPRGGKGIKSNAVNWQESIGFKIPFVYEDVKGEFEILEYNKSKKYISTKYNDEVYDIGTSNLLKCKLGRILKKITNEFKIEIGQIFKDDKRDLVITDREYRERSDNKGRNKYYKYTCNKCGWTEGWMIESDLKYGYGCSCCYNRTAVLGINTIWDTDRWMCDLGVREEDAKSNTYGSIKDIQVVCPHCKKIKTKKILNIYSSKSIGCICGDGFSYGEKLVYSLLSQLNIDFETQTSKRTFSWGGDKRYDFYIPSLNMIIETHGIQHYEQTKRNGARTLAEEQVNDKVKKELALNNGIQYYIELDCRNSSLEWIKNSVLNSELSDLFDLSKIDWSIADIYAIKNNKCRDICDYWNKHPESITSDLEPIFNLNRVTIINYLKKGARLGWCDYNPKEELRKNIRKNNSLKAKKIEIFKDNVSLGIFESMVELDKQSEELFGVKLGFRSISDVARGRRKHHKGFTFKYV